jgi:hypothetical protein
VELARERVVAAAAHCRNDDMEPPAPGKVDRLVGKAIEAFEDDSAGLRVSGCRGRPRPGPGSLRMPGACVDGAVGGDGPS